MREGDIVEGGKLVLVGKSAFWIRQDGEIHATTLPPKVIKEGTFRDQLDTLVDIQTQGTIREVARERLLDVLLQHWGSVRSFLPRGGVYIRSGFLVVETELGPSLIEKESILKVLPQASNRCRIILKSGGDPIDLYGFSSENVLAALIQY